jgi:hypothetical protein
MAHSSQATTIRLPSQGDIVSKEATFATQPVWLHQAVALFLFQQPCNGASSIATTTATTAWPQSTTTSNTTSCIPEITGDAANPLTEATSGSVPERLDAVKEDVLVVLFQQPCNEATTAITTTATTTAWPQSMTTATTTSCVPEASRDARLDAVEEDVGYQDNGLVKATDVSHAKRPTL